MWSREMNEKVYIQAKQHCHSRHHLLVGHELSGELRILLDHFDLLYEFGIIFEVLGTFAGI